MFSFCKLYETNKLLKQRILETKPNEPEAKQINKQWLKTFLCFLTSVKALNDSQVKNNESLAEFIGTLNPILLNLFYFPQPQP